MVSSHGIDFIKLKLSRVRPEKKNARQIKNKQKMSKVSVKSLAKGAGQDARNAKANGGGGGQDRPASR